MLRLSDPMHSEAHMNHEGRAATVERFWRLMEDRDWRAARALLAPGFV